MGAHLIDGEWQSDKYPTTPRGKVPLSVTDKTAQDLLWEYAQRRRIVDAEFSTDLETALVSAGYNPPSTKLGIAYIVLSFGYVESFIYSPIIFSTNDYFATQIDALNNLAKNLFLKFLNDNELNEDLEEDSSCCMLNKGNNFCKDCGKNLYDMHYIDFESYCSWLNDLCGHTVDGFGEDVENWDMFSTVKELMQTVKPHQIVEINCQSEILMARLLTPEMVPDAFKTCIESWQNDNANAYPIDNFLNS